MSAINEARELFERSGLVLPPIPRALQARLRRISEWCYATRDVDAMQMYMFGLYPAEAIAKLIDNYVALSHAGHGVNSYAINYHLVYGRVALFVQVGWGGVDMKEGKQEQMIAEAFAKCGEVLEAAAGVDAFERGRLVIAQSDFRGINVCSWLSEPTGDVETADRWLRARALPDGPALDSALVWLRNRAA